MVQVWNVQSLQQQKVPSNLDAGGTRALQGVADFCGWPPLAFDAGCRAQHPDGGHQSRSRASPCI